MEYIYHKGQPEANHFILLHGTGGDEESLMEVAKLLDSKATILSFRGNVSEDGMLRFFKRKGINQFDYESLEAETDELLAAIKKISQEEGVPLEKWVLVGYSNGANIAGHLLSERQTELQQGIFFHAMSLGRHTQDFSLAEKRLWFSKGDHDPLVSDGNFATLVGSLENRGAQVSVFEAGFGHQLTIEEVQAAKAWLVS